MSIWSPTYQQRVSKRYRSDKRLSEFYLQDGNENQLAYIIMDEFTSLSPYV